MERGTGPHRSPISGGSLTLAKDETVPIKESDGIASANGERVREKLKRSVQRHWGQEPCGTRGANPASRRDYFASIEQHRYEVEPYTPAFRRFPNHAR